MINVGRFCQFSNTRLVQFSLCNLVIQYVNLQIVQYSGDPDIVSYEFVPETIRINAVSQMSISKTFFKACF